MKTLNVIAEPPPLKATAIFGGTFDPVHYGHLRAAAELRTLLNVADFRFLPAGEPPHREQTHCSAEQRLKMLYLAVRQHPDLAVDDREVRRDGPSYMTDTLAELRQELPAGRPVLLIIGQDAANSLDHWHSWQTLFDQAHLLVMTRPDSTRDYQGELLAQMTARQSELGSIWSKPNGRVVHLPVTQLAISSTGIRNQLCRDESPRFLLPETVLRYILEKQLYKT